MGLLVSADFVPLPSRAPLASLALSPKETPSSGHLRVDVISSRPRTKNVPRTRLIDQGVFECPCEIDLQLSDVLERLATAGSYAFDFFAEPLEPSDLRLDADLQRSRDGGQTWSSSTVILDCRRTTPRSSHVAESIGERLRLRIRFVSTDPPNAPVPVRVWLRNPT